MSRISRRFKFFLVATFLALSLACSAPSDGTVRREFAKRYPKTKVTNVELIFERRSCRVPDNSRMERNFGRGTV